jgi:osmotically inducible protein OsmC
MYTMNINRVQNDCVIVNNYVPTHYGVRVVAERMGGRRFLPEAYASFPGRFVMKVLYTATATAIGGREGHVKSSDGVLDINVAIPKEMGGGGHVGTNPEQLFAAGYAACFESALRFLAQQEKHKITDSSVTARVGIGPRDEGGFGLAVELEVSLEGVSKEVAEALANAAHSAVCPYSNATRGNIDVKVTVV